MPNAILGLRRQGELVYDSHGFPVRNTVGPLVGRWPGRTRERGDGGWSIALDLAAWPVRQHDVVVDTGSGREWVVLTADPIKNNIDPACDYIRIDAREVVAGGTEPGGPEFVGRD
jgi:hypothetical protein